MCKNKKRKEQTETLQHLIWLIRAEYTSLIRVKHSKERLELSTKESITEIEQQRKKQDEAANCSTISRGCEAGASFCANSLPPLPHIFPSVNCHFLHWLAATLNVYHRHCCNRHCQSANRLCACLQEEEGERMDQRDSAWSSIAAVYNVTDTKDRQKPQTWECILMNCQNKL